MFSIFVLPRDPPNALLIGIISDMVVQVNPCAFTMSLLLIKTSKAGNFRTQKPLFILLI